jgi:hypothetical protein
MLSLIVVGYVSRSSLPKSLSLAWRSRRRIIYSLLCKAVLNSAISCGVKSADAPPFSFNGANCAGVRSLSVSLSCGRLPGIRLFMAIASPDVRARPAYGVVRLRSGHGSCVSQTGVVSVMEELCFCRSVLHTVSPPSSSFLLHSYAAALTLVEMIVVAPGTGLCDCEGLAAAGADIAYVQFRLIGMGRVRVGIE